jgi:hypothetical protein
MVKRTLLPAVCLVAAFVATTSAQSELDALMARVLETRDLNWKKLQQYTLNERETLQITALVVMRLYGFEREYLWFPREGFFIRSPLKSDGVAIAEDKRRQEEDKFLRNAQKRETSRKEREANRTKAGAAAEGYVPTPLAGPGDVVLTGAVEDVISQTFEPGFIQSANFMRFKFDAGSYALAGREKMLNRDVLKIEYYPKRLFDDNQSKPPCEQRKNGRCDKDDEFERDIEMKMNKVSLVTLWVDPAEHQILKYEFRFQDLDFLPGRTIVRFESARSTMEMAEPFANVWLPAQVGMRFRLGSAVGPLEVKYDVKYRDYRLPETSGRVLP